MTYFAKIATLNAAPYGAEEHRAYMAALGQAQARAARSYFDQHIIRMDDGTYWVADEGAYDTLMEDLVDRITHTVEAGLSDEW